MALPVVVYPNINPDDDARDLRDAMKGVGTDEKVLIKILTNRSRQQLQAVQAAFKAKFGKDLKTEIKKETSGNFRKVLIYRLKPNQFEMKKSGLLKAVKGAGTNERRLIDILAYTPNAEMALIKNDRVLVDKVVKDVSGHFKDAVKDLLGADRNENPQINPAEIAEDVRVLYKAGEKKIGTDEKAFIKILTNKAPWYNQALNQAYKQAHSHTLEHSIEKEFSGWLKELLVALVTPPYEYYTETLYKAMHGAGTNDDVLTWYFGYLEKNELKLIEMLFNKKYPKSLKDMIKADTTGHYEKVLLAMIDHF
jgi:DNA polymerase III delta subunit